MILESVGIARKCGQNLGILSFNLNNNDKNCCLHSNYIVLEFSGIIYFTYARRAFNV